MTGAEGTLVRWSVRRGGQIVGKVSTDGLGGRMADTGRSDIPSAHTALQRAEQGRAGLGDVPVMA